MRRILMVALWSAATTIAVVVAWRGVAVVADAGERRQEVATQASAAGLLSTTTTATTAPVATGPGATDPSGSTPVATGPSATAPTATEAPAIEPPATVPAPTTETRVAETTGGTVAVEFNSNATVRLLWAQPADGFTMEVPSSGPSVVEVRFERDDHESRIKAEWKGGVPDVEIEERPG